MKLTQRDDTDRYEHNEELSAKRVYVVNSNSELLPNHYQNIETKIERIEIPHIITQKELQIIELEKIIKVPEIHRIEVPIVVKQFEILEKPVLIKETEYKDLPLWIRLCLVAQILVSIITLLKK